MPEPVRDLRVPCRAVTPAEGPGQQQGQFFFGYYDKTPWSPDEAYLLANRATFLERMPQIGEPLSVGVVAAHGDTPTFTPLAETRAWNWQQGCMAQWVASPDGAPRFIYNDLQDGRPVSILYDLKSGTKRIFDAPIYHVAPDGRMALGVNFARVQRLRPGYGYIALEAEPPLPLDQDGVWQIDLQTGETRLIVSFTQLVAFQPDPAFGAAEHLEHWIDHLLIGPDGKRFMLLHRIQGADGYFTSRLLTADLDGKSLALLAVGMVSHYCWLRADQVMAWARRMTASRSQQAASLASRLGLGWARRLLGRMSFVRRRVIGDNFTIFHDPDGATERLDNPALGEDGHPMLSPRGRWLICDTYRDSESCRALFLYDLHKRRRHDLGRFYSPLVLGDTGFRCDLHPRWNRDGTQVSIDSAHEGSRRMYVLDVSQVIADAESR